MWHGAFPSVGVGGSHWAAGSFFVSSQCGIAFGVAFNATSEWMVFPLVGECPKNRSSWLAISRMWCIVCVLPEREFPSQASHKAKESAS